MKKLSDVSGFNILGLINVKYFFENRIKND